MPVTPIQPGAALKLRPSDIDSAAAALGCEVATLRAVMAVESRGSGFDDSRRPIILFEPHVFYRNLKGDELQHAIMLGIAYPRWGTRPYPKTSAENYERLEQARNINNESAFRSVSMGLGQILGENFRAAGYSSAGAMFVAACASEGNQLMQMVNFIKASRIDSYLRNKNWSGFAAHYNGPGYARNDYDVKLANAYRRAKMAG